MSNYFRFGGKSTRDFGMHIEKFPSIMGATRKRTTVSVAGRNGDLHYTENAFTNYKQPYECYFHGERPTPEQAHAIKAWLQNSGEYLRLEDTYDPTHYRMATYIGPLDITNHLNKYGRCTVYFDCAPQCFLKSGDLPVTFTAQGSIFNKTNQIALPLITVYGTGAGTVTIGDVTVEIKAVEDQMVLNCELQDTYKLTDGVMVNQNLNIYAPDFPVLEPGDNVITFSGNVTRLEIVPRWWEL